MTNNCSRCGGSGVYHWGARINGASQYSGVCFRCNGTGREPHVHEAGCRHNLRLSYKSPAVYIVQDYLQPGEEVCLDCGKVFAASDPDNWNNC